MAFVGLSIDEQTSIGVIANHWTAERAIITSNEPPRPHTQTHFLRSPSGYFLHVTAYTWAEAMADLGFLG